VNVEIECESELTMGATVVDWWRVTGKKPNATVCRSINAQGFFDLLVERISRLP
jgi:purine nucleosidase